MFVVAGNSINVFSNRMSGDGFRVAQVNFSILVDCFLLISVVVFLDAVEFGELCPSAGCDVFSLSLSLL
jgi:hypothetical protein